MQLFWFLVCGGVIVQISLIFFFSYRKIDFKKPKFYSLHIIYL